MLDRMSGDIHKLYGERKAAVIGAMSGVIVELGPGTGVNMRYYQPGVHVIAIEPNPHMHDRLRAQAAQHAVDLEIRTLVGEALDVPDASASGVVGTLVLCGVDDQHKVLAEVRRVLEPGGAYFFVEHVVAPAGSFNRRVQRLVKRPHRYLANGCEVDRDTSAAIHAAGFTKVELTQTDTVPANLYARHQIHGTATR
jgi:ubiquinone/menaquinone biosynthesis C-methylase UbiE